MKPFPRIITLTLAILLVLTPLAVFAQEAPVSLHLWRADTTEFPAVTVGLSAWDADGLPIAGLTPADFTLQEDGGAPFHPEQVASRTDAPLQVVLALDVSTSMSGKPLDDAKDAAARFLDHLTNADRAALIAFSDAVDPNPGNLNPEREIGFTANLDPLYDLIENLEAAGQTELYNAAAKSVRMFADQPTGHRAVLLLSDGRNEPPEVGDPDEAIRLSQEANVPFFVIGLGDEIDEPYLRRLANETGGLFRSAPTSAELAHLFNDMAALLKTQYQLTYTSELPADGGMHTLAITVAAAGGSATQEIEFGPLPDLPPTEVPTETPKPTATEEIPPTDPAPTDAPPTAVPPEPTNVPASPAAGKDVPWLWVGGAALLIFLAALGLFLFFRGRNQKTAEVCAKCGHDLTGKPGSCPQCGSTERLPKFKK